MAAPDLLLEAMHPIARFEWAFKWGVWSRRVEFDSYIQTQYAPATRANADFMYGT